MDIEETSQKALAVQMIQRLPDDATFDDMQYHLYVLEKIRKADEAARDGKVYTTAEARALVAQWLNH